MTDLQVAIQLTRIIVPIIIVFGIVSNSVNIIILTRRTLRRHACSNYFLAMGINNVLYSSIVLIYRLLTEAYQINPSSESLILCKITVFLTNLCAFISPYFIVLASIDRWCGSSLSAQQRKWSSVHIANWVIVITIIITVLFLLPFGIYAEIFNGSICSIGITNASMSIYISIEIVAFAGIAPFLMILFGFLTIYNTQQLRIIPIAQNRRTESQLVRMLLCQVGIHVLLTLPVCIMYLMSLSSPSFQANPNHHFITTILLLPLHLSYTTGCGVYILSAQIYRKELIRLFHKMTGNRGRNGNNRIHATMIALPTVV